MRILVVEDDALTARALTTILGEQTYAVELVQDGESAWNLVQSFPFDLVLLDIEIPHLDGLALCRQLRSQGFQQPILLLTARDSSHDKAVGLDAGADDYVTKPFDPEELAARVRALLRRSQVTSDPVLQHGDLRLDPSTCEVTFRQSASLPLTPKEYALLELFLRNPRRVFSCGAILEHLWAYGDAPGEEAVRTHIKGLRQKLKRADAPADLIETVYGIGYRLNPKVSEATVPAAPPTQAAPAGSLPRPSSQSTGELHPEQMQSAIAGVWERFKPRVDEQIQRLAQAAAQQVQGNVDPTVQQQAIAEAHSLAGSLGTFGFPAGSQLARTIYNQLRAETPTSSLANLPALVTELRQAVDLTPTTAPSSPAPAAPPPPPPTAFAARLMAVDDDPHILEVLHTLLVPWGLEIVTLADPGDFWPTLEQTEPDLLILDLHMPDPDGVELCRAIRESDRWSGLPILILTAYADAETVNRVFAVGVDDFVSKPIVAPELVTRIINRLERVQLQRRLGSAAAQKGRFFELALDWFCILELDGQFRSTNPACQTILGYPPDAIQQMSLLELTDPEDQQRTRDMLAELAAGETVVGFEQRCQTRTGGDRWLEWQAIPVDGEWVYATARDVTARKQQELALRKLKDEIELRVAERTAELVSVNQRLRQELTTAKRLEAERNRADEERRISDARFADILNIADDAIISVDQQQRITLFNQGAEKTFGYQAAAVLGQPLDILLPPGAVQIHRQHVQDFGQTQGMARQMGDRRPIFGRRKDGSEFPAEASISCLTRNGDKLFTVILRDITDRQKIDRMKDEFVSVVSHELRTPLTSIHGSLGMLASGLLAADSDQGKRLIQIAAESTDRLVRLVNDILDIERIESGKVTMEMQVCPVPDLVAHAVDAVQAIADKAGIQIETAPIETTIWADGDRIIQTLTNLLSNAIKFSPRDSTIWLTVAHLTAADPAPRADVQQPCLLFSVRDRGRGIPQNKLTAIFERFQQVDASDARRPDGTGLGLTICRSIVAQHGGQIWVESTVGEGSTFFFALPIVR